MLSLWTLLQKSLKPIYSTGGTPVNAASIFFLAELLMGRRLWMPLLLVMMQFKHIWHTLNKFCKWKAELKILQQQNISVWCSAEPLPEHNGDFKVTSLEKLG